MAKLTLSGNAITVTTKITSEDFFKIRLAERTKHCRMGR